VISQIVLLTSFLSLSYSQSIIGSWDLIEPHTKEIDGRKQVLIRHHYHADGSWQAYMWYEGRFKFAGEGKYTLYKNRLKRTIDDESYGGVIDFPTDTTMTLHWDGGQEQLLFKRLPKKPET